MVFPSEYEGFGAPVVEAMSLDTPVIAADQPAVAEVIGNAGLVLPRDPQAWLMRSTSWPTSELS